ncbi:MAG TPA: DinB family protein [Gemmatimonadales bacterium]|nr:DinB family protein [Gemmatimonadales bacterium]
MSGPTHRASRARHDQVLRTQVATLLDWQGAHVDFEAAVSGVPPELRGRRPPGLPHSLWELLEHLRICQWDILDYCVNPDYREPTSSGAYWPGTAEPPGPEAWDESAAAFRRDLAALRRLANDPKNALTDPLPHAPRHTYLRELLLVADHNAYHIGQMIQVRRLLGIWPA